MISILLLLAIAKTNIIVKDGVTETSIDEFNYIPNIYNDHIGVQNVIVKPEKLILRSTIDESSMIRWEKRNSHDNWSFIFDFNELNLEAREIASLFLFYTKEKPVIGAFKGGPSKFHGFSVGLEFTGKSIELIYSNNEDIEYKNIDKYVTTNDSINPQRFLGVEKLKFKVICTDKNFKVELYENNELLYDNFRYFTKDHLQFAKGGGYISIFADYKHVSSGKAFELTSAQLYQRDESADYSTTKVNMKKLTPELKSKSTIKHPNIDIQDLIFKINAVITYTKAMIGELPETSIIKAEKELLKETEQISEKIGRIKGHNAKKHYRNNLDNKVNQLDLKMKLILKNMGEIEYLTVTNEDSGKKKYYLILEYFMAVSGMIAVVFLIFREIKGYLEKRNIKKSNN